MALQAGPVEMASLVAESNDWAGGDVRWWISTVGNFSAMIGYAELFWPDFNEFDGCVLRGEVNEANFRAWMERLNGDRRAVEKVMNRVDLNYLFDGNYSIAATDFQLSYLGCLLREMWEAKLRREFPDRWFAVEFHEDPSNLDDEPLVTFSLIRPA